VFIRQNILAVDSKLLTFLLFPQIDTFLPFSEKNLIPPYFLHFPYFRSISVFCLIYVFFDFPHCDRMHHTIHAVDAPKNPF